MQPHFIEQFLSAPQFLIYRSILVLVLGFILGRLLNLTAVHLTNDTRTDTALTYKQESVFSRYPLTEICTCLMLYFSFSAFAITLHGLAMALFGSVLIVIFITDYSQKLIPLKIAYPAISLGIVYRSFFLCDRGTDNVKDTLVNLADKANGITYSSTYTLQTLSFVGFHPDIFLSTMTGIGISYILFEFIEFYGIKLLMFFEGDESEDIQVDRALDITEETIDDSDYVASGGCGVLAAVISSWLGLKVMLMSILIAFFIASLRAVLFFWEDANSRKELLSSDKVSFLTKTILSSAKFWERFPFGPTLVLAVAIVFFGQLIMLQF